MIERMPRLAWFTPLPPARSGIAAYSTELAPLLARDHEIDVFTHPFGDRTWKPASGGLRVFAAHDFLWKHDRSPYDLVVYQLGNAACHDFMWPHLARFPGLVVLHDGQVHHERSRALLSRGRVEEYRAEFRYNHPDAPEHLPDLVESALGGSLYYLYPMLRWVVRTSRLVMVHSEGLAAEIRAAHPGVDVRTVRMGVPDPVTPASAGAAAAIRQRHQVADGTVLFAAFGLVTPEKRVSATLRGLAALVRDGVDACLLLLGGTTGYYDAAAEASDLGVADRVRIAGYVPDEELAAHLLAADACLCLRWPTSRETSAMWIRALAAGRPTVITDLAHTADVPSLDPRTWREMEEGEEGSARRPEGGPVSVAIDLLDEDASLRLAMARLAPDAALRQQLGGNARAFWQAHHTMAHAVDGYHAAIERAIGRPARTVRDLPAHLLDDHTAPVRRLLSDLGVRTDLFPR
jgi:glycosyltransferase involved in cell wall biosynthesis